MRGEAGPAIEVQPRLATIVPQRWPVAVSPARDELLSSWLHRLAHAHGLSPRHFGERLGLGSGAWSARLDLDAPEFLLSLLHRETGVGRDRIAGMTIGAEPWRTLLLPLRWNEETGRRATWLQFCPLCLAGDATPYFRRGWRRASVMSCRRHGGALLDRCPSCGQGLAPFAPRARLAQHVCARCDFDLRDARPPRLARATRRSVDLIDDLVRLEAAKGVLDRSALIGRVLALPVLEKPTGAESFARLSTAERIRCVARLEGRLARHLGADPDPTLADGRRAIIAEGGVAPLLDALPRLLKGFARPARRRRVDKAPAVELPSLLSAYAAVSARRKRRGFEHGEVWVGA